MSSNANSVVHSSKLDYVRKMSLSTVIDLFIYLCPSPCRNTLAQSMECNVMISRSLVVLKMEHYLYMIF